MTHCDSTGSKADRLKSWKCYKVYESGVWSCTLPFSTQCRDTSTPGNYAVRVPRDCTRNQEQSVDDLITGDTTVKGA